MAASENWPSSEIADDIYARLCEEDPVAPADLAESYFEPLTLALIRNNANVDPHLCYQAAGDALLELIKNPRSYDRNRGALDVYLRMSSQGDLRNLLEKESRHRLRRADLEAVELSSQGRNVWQEEASNPEVIVERQMDAESAKARTTAITAKVSLSPEEAQVLTLMRQGERKTVEFARVLGISDWPADQQRREVKRAKDRINRRLERAELRDV
jgi:hypothetical protein